MGSMESPPQPEDTASKASILKNDKEKTKARQRQTLRFSQVVRKSVFHDEAEAIIAIQSSKDAIPLQVSIARGLGFLYFYVWRKRQHFRRLNNISKLFLQNIGPE